MHVAFNCFCIARSPQKPRTPIFWMDKWIVSANLGSLLILFIHGAWMFQTLPLSSTQQMEKCVMLRSICWKRFKGTWIKHLVTYVVCSKIDQNAHILYQTFPSTNHRFSQFRSVRFDQNLGYQNESAACHLLEESYPHRLPACDQRPCGRSKHLHHPNSPCRVKTLINHWENAHL